MERCCLALFVVFKIFILHITVFRSDRRSYFQDVKDKRGMREWKNDNS